MTSTSKAVRAFLTGLSQQIPETALPLLLKKENDALVTLLNSSIEGLPMGSPIRKSVDEALYEYVGWLRIELEKRLEEAKQANAVVTVEEDNESTNALLPVVNEDIFRLMLTRANNENDNDAVNVLKCMDFSTLEVFLQEEATMESIIHACKATLVCGQNRESNLDLFVSRFAKAFAAGDEVVEDKIEQVLAFVNILQTGGVSGFSFESLDIISAGDLGELLGCLTLFSILYPEKYLEIRTRFHQGDDSSDEEIDVRPKKRRKMSGLELKKLQMKCNRDINILLSLLFATMSSAKEHRVIAGSFTRSFVKIILLQNDSVSNLLGLKAKVSDDSTRAKLARDASAILINSMELGNIIDRREMPSVALISDGKKRCDLITKWADKIVMSAARADFDSGNVEEEDGESNVAFLMDRNPTDTDNMEMNVDENKSVDGNDSSLEQDSEIDSEPETPIERNFSKSRAKKATSTLPPVPENEEAVNITNESGNGDSASIIPPHADVESTPSIETPTRSKRSRSRVNSTSSTDTPTRSTRSSIRGLQPSSIDTAEDDAVVTTPLRKHARTRSASNTSDAEATPRRRSSRRSTNGESDSDVDSATPRRSSRKKK